MTQKNIFAMLFSFVMAVVLILAITCPWFLHFQGEFLDHWDPPFHAWKLEFIAKRILAGDWFVQTTNTNMLYPYSGTFVSLPYYIYYTFYCNIKQLFTHI